MTQIWFLRISNSNLSTHHFRWYSCKSYLNKLDSQCRFAYSTTSNYYQFVILVSSIIIASLIPWHNCVYTLTLQTIWGEGVCFETATETALHGNHGPLSNVNVGVKLTWLRPLSLCGSFCLKLFCTGTSHHSAWM